MTKLEKDLLKNIPVGRIYEYVDKNTSKTVYVGHTTLSLTEADRNHRFEQKFTRNGKYTLTKFRKFLRTSKGKDVSIQVIKELFNTTKKELLCLETMYILSYKDQKECDQNIDFYPLATYLEKKHKFRKERAIQEANYILEDYAAGAK